MNDQRTACGLPLPTRRPKLRASGQTSPNSNRRHSYSRRAAWYYIEAIQFDCGEAEHHLAVAWQGPDHERDVLPGEFLSPFNPKEKKR